MLVYYSLQSVYSKNFGVFPPKFKNFKSSPHLAPHLSSLGAEVLYSRVLLEQLEKNEVTMIIFRHFLNKKRSDNSNDDDKSQKIGKDHHDQQQQSRRRTKNQQQQHHKNQQHQIFGAVSMPGYKGNEELEWCNQDAYLFVMTDDHGNISTTSDGKIENPAANNDNCTSSSNSSSNKNKKNNRISFSETRSDVTSSSSTNRNDIHDMYREMSNNTKTKSLVVHEKVTAIIPFRSYK